MPRHHRLSRGLIGLLGVVVVLGLVFYFNNVRKTDASEQPQPQSRAEATVNPSVEQRGPTPVKQATSEPPKVNVRQSPANPATRPARQTAGLPASAGSDLTTLNEATKKKSAGDLLGARTVLNDALVGGRLSPSDSEAAKKMLAEIN